MASLIFLMFFLLSINANGLRKKGNWLGFIHCLQSLPSACVSDVECLAWFQGPNPVVWLSYFVRAFLLLRATLPKILIFNFHPEIDFAHNPSIKFTWQVGNKYEVISEKLNFFKIF